MKNSYKLKRANIGMVEKGGRQERDGWDACCHGDDL